MKKVFLRQKGRMYQIKTSIYAFDENYNRKIIILGHYHRPLFDSMDRIGG